MIKKLFLYWWHLLAGIGDEAKTHLSRLLEQVAAGERVVISKAGTPVADLVPHQAASVTFGGLKGEVAYTDDAFGIDPDIQEMFYGDAAS
jgi:antitoxin (DNA-binding transcriptional repressor) of toxin-antitoxin stability system